MKDEISIEHLAKLSRIKITPEEEKGMSQEISDILVYISKLQEVDISDLDAKAYLTDSHNVFSADEIQSNHQEKENIINAFPKKTGNALEVPAVFE